ncbi:hypothetical protein KP509_1Z246700 [Ceratopteris richardii]|nr:hypothetical protein KP509_1Z246700 [Ceratopteris richardii]
MIGVLMTWINATKLADLVYDRTGLQKTGEILIGMPEGDNEVRFLFPPHSNQSYTIHRRYGAMEKAINGEAGIDIMHDYKDEKVIAAYRPVGFMRWGLIAKLDISEAYAPVKNIWTVIISTIPSLVLAGILASVGLAKVAERTADLACANEGLANEINERRKIETELEKAKNIALAANKSKSEFLANMSHELRTPLNAIVNFTEFCLGTKVTLEQKEQLEQVQFAAQHLLRLITDILDLSKIEAGKLEIEEIEFSLFHQLEHAISVFAARALENDIELCCSFGEDVPDHIVGDPGRLLQILVNLIGNGIKFTKKGEVVTSVLMKSRTVETVELLFSVRDTGMGIPEDKKSLLFQAFSHIDSSTQRLYSGTGLGLLISAKLAAAMKGRMWVESDGIEDHGSTFWFTAVFQLPRSSHQSRCSKPHFKGVRCLVVDDNVTSRTTLTNLLKTWGAEAHAEGTVEAALSVLQRAASLDQKYNIVLLDLWLKGTDSSDFIFNLHREPTLLENCTSRNIQRNNSVLNYDSSSASDYERASDNETKTVIIGNNSAFNLSVDSIKCLDKSSVFNSGNEQNSKHNIGNDLDGVISNSISGSPKEIAQERQPDPYLVSDAFRTAKVSRSSERILPSVIMLTSVNHMDVDRYTYIFCSFIFHPRFILLVQH